MIKPGSSTFTYSRKDWDAAKAEAKSVLRRIARKETTISYSELADQIGAIHLEAFGAPMSHFLGEISVEEDADGHGMLSAVVVHKTGDRKPGPGFYDCASFLGRDVSDIDKTWANELTNVYRLHS